ncbi:hypothetical protein RUM43_013944 [Polyplax serrata]|uniref:Amino acid transporter transmembrane domain-containing protein n=1 Tax=Polyplax serrata TaxID=468196 RepID=A0AAN8RZM2_POLSC
MGEEEPYNPFEHRNVRKPTSDFGALAHLLKTSLGSGILAMPMAFKNAGLVLGAFGTIFLGIICTHCIQMLVAEFYFKPGVDVRYYVLALWIPLILMCMFRNLKSLVPFSIIANIFVVICFGITLYYIFRSINSTHTVRLVAPPDRWPLFLSTVIFAIEGIGTVLPIEHEMRHPEHFLGGCCGIIYIAMAIVVGFYGFIGFFGYLEYGDATKGSITLNLPVQDWMAQMVKILIAMAIFFTYALQFYVPINIIWNIIKNRISDKWKMTADLSVRTGLVTLTIVVAILVPNLEPIISLVGAVCFSMLGLFLPALLDTIVRWPYLGRAKWRLVKNCIIIMISLLALVSGTYSSALDIIDMYKIKKK